MPHIHSPLVLAVGLLASGLAAQGFDPPVAVDINPDPNIVEVNLTAAPTTWSYVPGQTTQVWAYNGSIPGPTIEANVGNTLIVHLTNNLPEPTTIHWHGVELPADQDGSHISQLTVPPGGTFTYSFPLLRASLYWYHPHVRTFDQIEKGLHGCLLVRDPQKEMQFGFRKIEEHIVVFDDILLDANYQVVPAFSFTDPLKNATYQLNGREGNYLLVNGKEATNVTLPVANGKPQRWRCVNAANTTFCRIDINDVMTGFNNVALWEVGNDFGYGEQRIRRGAITSTAPGGDHPGQALISQMGQGMLLFPGERMDLIFTPSGTDGQVFTLQQNDWFRGRHTAFFGPGGSIFMGNDPLDGSYPNKPYFKVQTVGPNPATEAYLPPFNLVPYPPVAGPSLGKIPYYFGHGLPDPQGNVPFHAEGKAIFGGIVQPIPSWQVTSAIAADVQVGDTWTLEITNLTHGDHPYHQHGFFFEMLDYEFQDDTDPTNPALNFKFAPIWRIMKDTLRLPPRLGAKGSSRCITRLLVHYDDTGRKGQIAAHGEQATFHRNGSWTSGGWLLHCHILEHSGRGMLTFFEVRDPNDPFHLLGRHFPGTLGNPYLTGRGDMAPGTAVHLDVQNVLPNTPVFLLIGGTAGSSPFQGGTLVPYLPAGCVSGNTDSNGEATWSFTEWSKLPKGTPIYWQTGFQDSGAQRGWALSNALMFQTR